MSRTRGASKTLHDDDGIVLGKGGVPLSHTSGPPEHEGRVPLDRQGNPVSPSAAYLAPVRKLSGDTVIRGPGAEPAPARRMPVMYRSDRASWSRLMEAFDLAMLLDLALRDPGKLGEGLVIEVTPEEHARLSGNMKLHFKPVFEQGS